MAFHKTATGRNIDSNDVTYYNLTITGIDNFNSGKIYGKNEYPIIANISANQNIPILEKPDDHYTSIIRFSVPCLSLPLIQFLIQTPVTDINLGIYSFTLKYQNFQSPQTFVMFSPEIFPPACINPLVGTPTQTFSNYYFLYDYSHLLGMWNNALITATTALNTIAETAFVAPFFHYDAITSLISLYADASSFDGYLPNPVKIWFNAPFATFMQAIPYHSYTYGDPNGLDNEIQVYNGQGLNTKIIGTITYDVVSQQYISLSYMSYLKSIIIATDMNITSESSYVNDPSSIQNTAYTNILTDFIPDLSVPVAGISSGIFIYDASSLYRIFEFKQSTPLMNLSVKLYFTDNLGNQYPLYLNKGQSVNIKFMFIKKNLLKLI